MHKKILFRFAAAVMLASLYGCEGGRSFSLGDRIGVCGSLSDAELMKRAGASFVEANVYGFLMPECSEDEFAANRKIAAACALPIYSANGFFPGDLKITGPDADLERALKYSETAIRRAAETGIRCLVLGSGCSRTVPEDFDHAAAEGQFLSLLRGIAPFAEKYDVTVVIEPLRREETNLINTVCEGAEMARRSGSDHICVLADFYHMLQNGESPGSLARCKDRLRHCHIAEKERRTPPGVCGDDFTPFFRVLKEMGYEGGVSIECGWSDMEKELPVAIITMKEQINRINRN